MIDIYHIWTIGESRFTKPISKQILIGVYNKIKVYYNPIFLW